VLQGSRRQSEMGEPDTHGSFFGELWEVRALASSPSLVGDIEREQQQRRQRQEQVVEG
jgi:hypothetical protein